MAVKSNVIITGTTYGRLNMRFEPFSPEVLKKLRKERSISQRTLADSAGLPLITLKKIEQGINDPSAATLKLLGKYFDLFFYIDWEKSESPDN